MNYKKAYELITLPSKPILELWDKQTTFFNKLADELYKAGFQMSLESHKLFTIQFLDTVLRFELASPDYSKEQIQCRIYVREHKAKSDTVGAYTEITHWSYVRSFQAIHTQGAEEKAQLTRPVQENEFPIYLAHDVASFFGIKVPPVRDLVFHASNP